MSSGYLAQLSARGSMPALEPPRTPFPAEAAMDRPAVQPGVPSSRPGGLELSRPEIETPDNGGIGVENRSPMRPVALGMDEPAPHAAPVPTSAHTEPALPRPASAAPYRTEFDAAPAPTPWPAIDPANPPTAANRIPQVRAAALQSEVGAAVPSRASAPPEAMVSDQPIAAPARTAAMPLDQPVAAPAPTPWPAIYPPASQPFITQARSLADPANPPTAANRIPQVRAAIPQSEIGTAVLSRASAPPAAMVSDQPIAAQARTPAAPSLVTSEAQAERSRPAPESTAPHPSDPPTAVRPSLPGRIMAPDPTARAAEAEPPAGLAAMERLTALWHDRAVRPAPRPTTGGSQGVRIGTLEVRLTPPAPPPAPLPTPQAAAAPPAPLARGFRAFGLRQS